MIRKVDQELAGPLKPGVEYYFDENPVHVYYVSQTFTSKPLSEQEVEASDYVRIGMVRPDQRIDHETTYVRVRQPFPIDPVNFSSLTDGEHFYHRSSKDFTLDSISLTEAIHSEDYIKVVKSKGKIELAIHVTTPSMVTTQYTYYQNGHFKDSFGVKREGNVSEPSELEFDETTGQPTVLKVNGVVQK